MGFGPDLKEATEHALREMIDSPGGGETKHRTRDDVYMLSSVAVDLDITQLVDGKVGAHAMCRENIFYGYCRQANWLPSLGVSCRGPNP
jgi:acetamidase/formamidase